MNGEEQCKGFLISCDQNKQKQAIKDAYNFLARFIEDEYDDLEGNLIKKELAESGKEVNLENELKAVNKAANKLLYTIDTNVKCLIFIKINPKYGQIDPNVIVQKIMKAVHQENAEITRFCHKILPVEKCFKAEHFRMLDKIDQLFQLRNNQQIRSWALNYKCRNNSKFNYKEILTETEKIAQRYGHFVDIYYPQWTISIQIVNHMMCICICEKYKQYSEFKLRKKGPKPQKREPNPHKQQKSLQKNKKQAMRNKKQEKIREGILPQKQKQQQIPQKKQQQNQPQQPSKLLTQKIDIENDDDDVDII